MRQEMRAAGQSVEMEQTRPSACRTRLRSRSPLETCDLVLDDENAGAGGNPLGEAVPRGEHGLDRERPSVLGRDLHPRVQDKTGRDVGDEAMREGEQEEMDVERSTALSSRFAF